MHTIYAFYSIFNKCLFTLTTLQMPNLALTHKKTDNSAAVSCMWGMSLIWMGIYTVTVSVSCELVLNLALAPSWVSMEHLLKLKCGHSPWNLRILTHLHSRLHVQMENLALTQTRITVYTWPELCLWYLGSWLGKWWRDGWPAFSSPSCFSVTNRCYFIMLLTRARMHPHNKK